MMPDYWRIRAPRPDFITLSSYFDNFYLFDGFRAAPGGLSPPSLAEVRLRGCGLEGVLGPGWRRANLLRHRPKRLKKVDRVF